jgi:hypothetical protein
MFPTARAPCGIGRGIILAFFISSCFHGEVAADRSQPVSQATPASGTAIEQNSRPKRLSPRERAAAKRAQRAAALQAQREEEHRRWLARVKANGVEPWPEETDVEHAAALKRSRAMIDEVISLLPGTQLYETDHFLFTSNIPPAQAAPYVRYIDRMYDWMCQLYGVPADTKVWLGGKAPIFAFLTREQFVGFETKYFQPPAPDIYGLCHQNSRGDVVIACFRGEDPDDFGQMLVHETSHGFIHRYKTKARLPTWVNEGMAELIGAEMVPRSKSVKNKELVALAVMKQQRSLGRDFFVTDDLEAWQYGAASSLNRFLLETNRQSYVAFIEGLKEGLPWPKALQRAYGGTPEQLVVQYGQRIGVPGLQP